MKKILFIIAGLLVSNLLIAQTKTWNTGNGNWSTGANWTPAGAPAPTNSNDITIDCSCTVTNTQDLVLDGSLFIGAGSTLDMGGFKLELGTTNNDASFTNHGTITNSGKIFVKGTATGLGLGPWLINTGTINASEMQIGNDAGGGVLTNSSTGTINLTAGVHLDGTMCNEGNMFLGGTLKNHGGDISCCGFIETPSLDIDINTGRAGNFGCTDICTSGGGDPIIDIEGTVYSDLKDAFDNAPDTQVGIDPDNTFLCGSNVNGQSGPVLFPTGPGGVGRTDGTSSLSLWLDAGKITGAADGADMVTWTDQSGNDYDAVVGTAAPSYSATGGGNSQPAVTFDQTSTENMVITTNTEIMPVAEVSVFVAGNYENGSDNWASLISANDDDARDDGWAIQRDNATSDINFWVDDIASNACTKPFGDGTDEIWNLIFKTTDNMGYGYKSEDVCSFAFNGPMNYNGGANDDLLIGVGPDNVGPAYYLTGDIEEIIEFDAAVNDAQRIIISNYLAAKYAITLANNDAYDEDVNGDYDFEVAGIGRVDVLNIHDDAQGPSIVRILNPTGLGDDEFLIWGHDNGVESATDTTDLPAGVEAKFARIRRVSEANSSGATVDVGNIDIRWDLAGKGSVTVADLRLLVDEDNDGTFADETPISGATLVSGNVYVFSGVSAIADNLRFTLGTADTVQTPLLAASECSYNSSTVTQATTTDVNQWSFDNEIIGIELSIGFTGCTELDTLREFRFDTDGNNGTGTDNPTTNISAATVFYTGTNSTFDNNTPFGSVSNPSGTFAITGEQTLSGGTHYFWLTYDVPFDANVGDDLDARVDSILINTTWRTDMADNEPAGKRTIVGPSTFRHSVADGLWNATSTWAATDNGAPGASVPSGAFIVFIDTGTTVDMNANFTVNDVLIQHGGFLDRGAGTLTTNATLRTEGSGRFDLDEALVVNGDADLKGTGLSRSREIMTFNGDLCIEGGATLTALRNKDITIQGSLIVNGILNLGSITTKMLKWDGAGTQTLSGTGSILASDLATTFEITSGGRTVLAGTDLTVQPRIFINDNLTVTNLGTITLSQTAVANHGDLDGQAASSASWVNGASATLNYGGANDMFVTGGSLTASASNNTVNYNRSTAQAVIQPTSSQYWNLSVSTGGTKTLDNAVDVDGDLTMASGVTLDTDTWDINLAGDWINNGGTFVENMQAVTFDGSAAQTITNTAGETFFDVIVSQTSDSLVLDQSNSTDVTVTGTLTLIQGVVNTTTTELLTIVAGASSNIGDADSYVDGPMRKIGNTDFSFPTGDLAIWAPVEITNITAGAADEYTAEYFDFMAPFSANVPGTGIIDHVSFVEYWVIDTVGSGSVTSTDVTFHWKDGTRSDITDLGDLIAIHYNSGTAMWEVPAGGTTLCGGSTLALGCITATFTQFSPIGFGSESGPNPLPIELLSFEANFDGRVAQLKWSTASETNNNFFTLERTQDLEVFDEIAQIPGAGDSYDILEYSFIDERPLPGSSFYRLKQTDFDGQFTYSNVVSIQNLNSEFDLVVWPNPSNGAEISMELIGVEDGAKVVVQDLFGRKIMEQDVAEGQSHFTLDATLGQGLYMVTLYAGSNRLIKKFIVN